MSEVLTKKHVNWNVYKNTTLMRNRMGNQPMNNRSTANP